MKLNIKMSIENISSFKNVISTLKNEKIISADLFIKNLDFFKIKRILYYIINNFENKTSIIFYDVPYCILPDAEEHIINLPSEKKEKSDECKKCKFNNFCGGFPTYANKFLPVSDIPKEISIELTSKCNLNCNFCFNKIVYKNDYKLDKEYVFDILDQASELGIKRARFTGGEPLLYENLNEVMNYAKKMGFSIWLNTNGTMNYDKINLGSIDSILVPIHHSDNKIESKITGYEDSLKTKLKAFSLLKQKIKDVRIGTAISSQNLNNLEQLYLLSKKLGVRWELYRTIGDEKTDYNKVYEQLLDIYSKFDERNIITNAFPWCFFGINDNDISKTRLFSLGGFLDDGRDRLVVSADGRIKPTYYSLDYMKNKKLRDAWNSERMKGIRSLEFLPAKCKKCLYFPVCKGGSRTLAKNTYGGYYENDPILSKINAKLPDS